MQLWTNTYDTTTTMNLIDKITAEVDTRFKNWAFRGSIVDWYYFNGQVIIKDFDIVTSDPFEPGHVCDFWGPRMSWTFMRRAIDVFADPNPGPRMQTIEGRMETLRWLAEKFPSRADSNLAMLARYQQLHKTNFRPIPVASVSNPQPKVECKHRGGPVLTIICDQCGNGKGQEKPVYECRLHGLCTHRLERRGQEQQTPPIHVCVGCDDGPWPR